MLRSLVLFLLAVSGLIAQTTYQQTDSIPACDINDAALCAASIANPDSPLDSFLQVGGTAGTTERAWTMANNDPIQVCAYFATGSVGLTSWPSGNYVVNWDITTAGSSADWDRTYVCRMPNDCNTVTATVGSNTGLAKDISTAADYQDTVSGSSQASTNTTDRLLVVIACVETMTHGNVNMGFTPSLTIQAPWTITSGVDGKGALNFPLTY